MSMFHLHSVSPTIDVFVTMCWQWLKVHFSAPNGILNSKLRRGQWLT